MVCWWMGDTLSDKTTKTARSYRTAVIDDNAVISLNLKWLGQIIILIGGLVYGYYRIETRIGQLEVSMEGRMQKLKNFWQSTWLMSKKNVSNSKNE